MAVIGGDHDQRFGGIGVVDRILHRAREFDRLFQRIARLPGVVRVIDPPAFDHQVETIRISLQPRDRLRGHVGEGRLGRIRLPVGHEGQVTGVEQAEHRLVHWRGGQFGGGLDHGAAVGRGPCTGQIGARIDPAATALLVLAVEHRGAAAERDVELALCQLQRDVLAALPLLVGGDVGVALPVTIRAARIDAGRSRMGQARRGDDPERESALFHFLAQQRQGIGERILAHALFRIRPDAEHSDAGLGPRMHRGRRASAVGNLRIGVVGLDQRKVIELLEAEPVFLPRLAALLPFVNARSGDGGDAHAVTDEQDHVLRLLRRGSFSHRSGARIARPGCVDGGHTPAQGQGCGEQSDHRAGRGHRRSPCDARYRLAMGR